MDIKQLNSIINSKYNVLHRIKTPLILIGGTSQVINHWIPMVEILKPYHDVFIYETRGQVRIIYYIIKIKQGSTTLSNIDCSLPTQVEDFIQLIRRMNYYNNVKVNLCGFSYGGRLSLSIANNHPDIVNKVIITGVGSGRGEKGNQIHQQWIEYLEQGDLENMIRSCITHSYSKSFLLKNQRYIDKWVKRTCEMNNQKNLHNLITHTLVSKNSPYSPTNLSRGIHCPVLSIAGDKDELIPIKNAIELAEIGHFNIKIIKDAGHNVPVENTYAWTKAVIDFLK